MKKVLRAKYLLIISVLLLAPMLFLGGKVLAQLILPATEPGGVVVDMPPSYVSGDPAYANTLPPDENTITDAASPSASFTYFQVTGATLRGRNSTTGYLYDGVGCSHTTAGVGAGMILNTEAAIPDGSVIKYLRVYYKDTNPTNGVEGFITRYQPGVAAVDLVHAGSTDAFSDGFGFVVSSEITETVNNSTYAYTLIGWPDDNNVANQICGLRIAYYQPFHVAIYLPTIRR